MGCQLTKVRQPNELTGIMMKSEAKQTVHQGKEGWLYLDGGNNPFMAHLKGAVTMPPETIQAWRNLLNERRQCFTSMDIQYCHVFAPEKASVYPEYVDENIDPSLGFISTFSRHFPDLFINVLPFFEKIKKDVQLYNKTDTHWNFSGCFACYQLICGQLGIAPNKSIAASPFHNANALLDLGAKTTPPTRERIKVRAIQKNYVRIFSNILIDYKEKNGIENEVGLHVGSHAIFQNEKAPHLQKVVIFGDSFSEYRPGLLSSMLAETFSEVHFVWSANIDKDYVKKVKPDIVITEICERFAGTVPNDNFNLSQFESARMKAYMESKQQAVVPMTNIAIENQTSPATYPKDEPGAASKLPDYLIIGSMKCGTTILNDFICMHPDVLPAKQKEIHYFSMYYDKGLDWYGEFFSHVPKDKVVGEASPTYLDTTTDITPLPRLINATLPNVKIIAILKDPVSRALSHFFHLRDINKLEAFQSLDPNDIFSGDLAEKYHNEFMLNAELRPMRFVLDFGNYYFKLEAYKEVFGDRLLILNNEELWSSGQTVMDKVFRHLELTGFQSPDFEKKRYVTSEKRRNINHVALSALRDYYLSNMKLVEERWGIKLNKETKSAA